METMYLACAVIGGVLLVLQTLAMLLGIDGDVDADAGVDADAAGAFFQVFSFKTLVSFFTFFGLVGRLADRAGQPAWIAFGAALCAGLAALFVVAWLMAGLARLQSRGNLDLLNALGSLGRVYLRIPAAAAGRGKVTLSVQGRSVEVKALTAGRELPTGSLVEVVAVPASDTVEVVAAEKE